MGAKPPPMKGGVGAKPPTTKGAGGKAPSLGYILLCLDKVRVKVYNMYALELGKTGFLRTLGMSCTLQ